YIPSARLAPLNDVALIAPAAQPTYARHYIAEAAAYTIPRLVLPLDLSPMPPVIYSESAELVGYILVALLLMLGLWTARPSLRLAVFLLLGGLLPFAAVQLPDYVMEHRF